MAQEKAHASAGLALNCIIAGFGACLYHRRTIPGFRPHVLFFRTQATQCVQGCRNLHHRKLGGVAGGRIWNLELWHEAPDAEPFAIRSLVVLPLDNLMNDPEQAIDWLGKAFAARKSHKHYIKQGAQLNSLRDYPRFVSLIERMGW